MRIAQLAPLAESVPPRLYGGTERVVAWLVDELVELGHDVTLFASGDSRTKGKLHPVWPRALRLGRKGADPNAACALLLEAIAKRAKDFDVIHAHIDWLPLPLLSRLGVPFLIAALAVEPFAAFLVRFRSYLPYVEKTMGALLVLTGLAFLFGFFTQLNTWLIEMFPVLQTIG